MFFKIFVLCIVARGFVSVETGQEEEDTTCQIDDNIYKRFATKTSYPMVNGTLSKNDYDVTDCEPEKFWLLSRHGAAYPTQSVMVGFEELTTLLELLDETHKTCAELEEWIPHNDNYEALSEEGAQILKELAGRYRVGFEDLFNSSGNFLFQHTEAIRTKQSCEEFVSGLQLDVVVEKNEDMLKFHEQCDKWADNNKTEDEPNSESLKFEMSDKFKATIENIKSNLNLTVNLTIDQVNKIWDMCRYEKAWKNVVLSPWCLAFTKEDIDVLEYREDLKSYYKAGHGHEINSRVACKTVVDMLDHLKTTNISMPKVIAYFADASTIQLFLTALGVRKDNVGLTAANFDHMQDRKWKTSEISPFTSNIAVVKYNCEGEEEPKVKFFLNEKVLKFDWCTNSTDDSCKLSQVLEKYREFDDVDCVNYYCSGKAKIVYGFFYIVLGSILIYLY